MRINKSGPSRQRSQLGCICIVFGLLMFALLALTWLSFYGPSPYFLHTTTISHLYFALYVLLTATGYLYIFLSGLSSRIFHAGPMADFSIGLGILVVIASLGYAWMPAVFLVLFGLRLTFGKSSLL